MKGVRVLLVHRVTADRSVIGTSFHSLKKGGPSSWKRGRALSRSGDTSGTNEKASLCSSSSLSKTSCCRLACTRPSS